MDASRLVEIQNQVVVCCANGIPRNWDAAVVNIEIDTVDGEQTENCLAAYFRKRQSEWERSSFQIPHDCYERFSELRDATKSEGIWTSCTLEFRSDGQYKFSYSFKKPKRLNGVHDAESMLEGYLPSV